MRRLLLLPLLAVLACSTSDPAAPDDPEVESAPALEITSPARSAYLTSGTMDDMALTIAGTACDALNAVTGATLNGAAAALSGTGTCRDVTGSVNSSWGLNTLRLLVQNQLGDEVGLVQSYLRSGEYLTGPVPSPSRMRAPGDGSGLQNAWMVRFGQAMIDDVDRSDVDDLATVMELVLGYGLDTLLALLEDEVPRPLTNTITVTTRDCIINSRDGDYLNGVRVNRGIIGGAQFELGEIAVVDDQIALVFSVGPMEASLSVTGYVDLLCAGGNPSAGASGSIGTDEAVVSVVLDVMQNGSSLDVAVSNVDVFLPSGMDVNISLTGIDLIDDLISTALTFAVNVFTQSLSIVFNAFAQDYIAEWTKTVLSLDAIGIAAMPESPLLGVTLGYDVDTDLVELGDGFIAYSISTHVFPADTVKSPAELAKGSIVGVSTPPTFDLMSSSLGLGMQHDFINQFFWAFWAGGAFDGRAGPIIDTLNANLDVPGFTITSMEATLPPVLEPGDTDAEVKIGIGDVLLRADITQTQPTLFAGQPVITVQVPLDIYVSLKLTATLGLDPVTRALTFSFSGDSEVGVQVVNALRTPQVQDLESLITTAMEELAKALITEVGAQVTLPQIPLGSLPGVPDPTTWVLDNGQFIQADRFIRIQGTVGVLN